MMGGYQCTFLSIRSAGRLLIVAVHLPSKLYQTDDDQAFYVRRLSEEISEQEKEIGHNQTMVIGDFNMDPFETGMILADGLHAVMDKNIAKDRNRNVRGKSYPLFYNPMWSKYLVVISVRPSGTYFYNDYSATTRFWHTFDQILIRPDLLEILDAASLHVVSHVAEKSLLSARGIDQSVSDHLPIVLRLDIERGG